MGRATSEKGAGIPPQIVRTMIATFTYTISKLHFVSNPPVFDRLDSVLDRLVMTYYD